MNQLRRTGLQGRISLYVAVGLVLMLGIYAYLGMRAVHRSTALVFQERQALAEGLAAALSQGFEHVAEDVQEDLKGLSADSPPLLLETAVRGAFHHVSEVDRFPFFKVSALWLVGGDGRVMAELPQPLPIPMASFPPPLWESPDPQVFHSAEPGGGTSFVLIGVPLTDGQGSVWGVALVNTQASNSPQPFTPLSLLSLTSGAPQAPPQSQYHLEVSSSQGTSLLFIGSTQLPGRPSPHISWIQSAVEGGGSFIAYHDAPHAQQPVEHIAVLVPVPGSGLYLVLEQEEDIALALPYELRRQLITFGGIGLLIALSVVWVTTRQVVKPVRALSRVAQRMAKGELSAPIAVPAQDEIQDLAGSIETMRQQIVSALGEIELANQRLESQVRERTQQLSEALKKVITAQEEERRRLARELHDETAQNLGALSIMLDGIRDTALTQPQAALQQALEARELAAKLLEETRRLIFDLRPTVLDDFGLVPALRWLAESRLERQGIEVSFQADNPVLSPEVQVAVFRIAQEAINNIVKHAQARHARIEVSSRDNVTTLVVADDGRGFDVAAADTDFKAGLAGMRERARLLGANLELRSRPGGGTRVRLEVPLEPKSG